MAEKRLDEPISVPVGYPTSVVYIDESGSANNDRFFVVGALKVRSHGAFSRSVRAVRERHDFHDEFRLNRVRRTKLPVYFDLLDQLQRPSIHFAACVVDKERFDPFQDCNSSWEAYAAIAVRLLRACIVRRELVTVSMDLVSTPPNVAIEDVVRTRVNRGFRNLSVVTAAALDSRTCDGLQVADILTGAVAFERRAAAGQSGRDNSPKGQVVARVRTSFGVTALSGRIDRINIAEYEKPQPRRGARRLRMVPGKGSRAS